MRMSTFVPVIVAALVDLAVVVVAALFIIGAVQAGIESGWSNSEWVSIAVTALIAFSVIVVTSIIAFAVNVSQMKRDF